MTFQNANIDFTIYSPRFQEWTGTDWILEKYKDKIYKIDEYNSELSIKHFDNELISVIVDDYISELNDSKSQYERISFDAGFQIKLNDKRIDYNCCGEFCNYFNWESILTNKKSVWIELWIGHPWIYYKMSDGFIYFSEYTEDEEDIKVLMKLEYDHFASTLKEWLKEIEIFKQKVKTIIEKKYPERSEYYYKQMIEGK